MNRLIQRRLQMVQYRAKTQKREYGTQPFIPQRGSPEPLRLPNLSNALGIQP